MKRLTKFILCRICKKLVIQGPWHKSNIIEYYKIMRDAAENEFTEDNKPTLDSFLTECHQEANKN